MSKRRFTLSAFLIAGALAASAQAEIRSVRGPGYDDRASLNVDVGFFYDELSPYGRWIEHDSYGPVWTPRSVSGDWQPYRSGRWVDSDYGWTWDSDEPFGWATYHYGRWSHDPDYGWIWVPGTDWGPAWVAWQEGGDYIGWAPLPPSVGYSANVGLRLGGINLSLALAPAAYVYVEQRAFLQPRLSSYCIPRSRNADVFRRTRNITRYGYDNQRIVNYGVAVDRIERVTNRRVQRVRVAEAQSRTALGVRDNELRVFRPAQERLRTVRVAARNNAGLAMKPRPAGAGGRERAAVQPAPQRSQGNVRMTQEQQQRELTAQRQRQIAERNRVAAEQRSEQQRSTRERQQLKPRPMDQSKAPAARQVQPPRESAVSVRGRETRDRQERQEAVQQREARQRQSVEAQRNAQRQSAGRERQAPKPERREAVRPPAAPRNVDRTPEAKRPPQVNKPEPRRGQAQGGKPQGGRPNAPRQKPQADGSPPPRH